jgi:DNA-binding NtrC family response regulator
MKAEVQKMSGDLQVQRRILVVEDDEDMRENLRRILMGAGYEVQLTQDGTEALAALQSLPFHLVITDLIMPRMSGLDLLQVVRKKHRDLPVLFLTAFGDWATFVKAMDMGVVDFLTKPFRADSLLGVIQGILNRPGRESGREGSGAGQPGGR